MKPLKRTGRSFSDTRSPAKYNLLQNIRKIIKPEDGELLSENDQREVFCVLKDDLSPEELSGLLQSKKGVIFTLQDDLLQRLLNLEKDYRHLKALSLTDELTGLYNKRFFNKQLKIEIARAKRTGQPFCLMLIDLDNFKTVNDTRGHLKGDEFLITLCRQICRKIRSTDYACRYGGDEFVIIMPTTYLTDGVSVAQRWHNVVKEVASRMEVSVSASIGIDEFDISQGVNAENFLERVDKELYNAKNSGKNRVSYPGERFLQGRKEGRFVPSAEKDPLYRTSVGVMSKRKRNLPRSEF